VSSSLCPSFSRWSNVSSTTGHEQHVWTQLPGYDEWDHDGDWWDQIKEGLPCSPDVTYFRYSVYDAYDEIKWSVLVRGVVKEHESLFVEKEGEHWVDYARLLLARSVIVIN